MVFSSPESLANVLCNCGLCNSWTQVLSSCPELTLLSLACSGPCAVLRVPFPGRGREMYFVDFTGVCDCVFKIRCLRKVWLSLMQTVIKDLAWGKAASLGKRLHAIKG